MLVGETDCDPDAATEPISWLIDTLVAFVDDQLSVDAPPGLIVLGEADKLTVGGGTTVTVTVPVSLPAEFSPVAV